MMCAFAFEAYLNFLGQKLTENWEERQRYDKKVKKVLARLKITPHQTARPYV
jgi:hypothetical protein